MAPPTVINSGFLPKEATAWATCTPGHRQEPLIIITCGTDSACWGCLPHPSSKPHAGRRTGEVGEGGDDVATWARTSSPTCPWLAHLEPGAPHGLPLPAPAPHPA